MHQGRPCADEPLAHAMERWDIMLVAVLERHKTPGGPCHRCRDGLGMRFTSWPYARTRLAPSCTPPQASMPMCTGGSCALKGLAQFIAVC